MQSQREHLIKGRKPFPKNTFAYSLKKGHVINYVMFVYETLTVDGEEQNLAAVKMKRVCLPPSGKGAGMSQPLSWKLRRKALRLLQPSVSKFEQSHCLKNRGRLLIRTDVRERCFFLY